MDEKLLAAVEAYVEKYWYGVQLTYTPPPPPKPADSVSKPGGRKFSIRVVDHSYKPKTPPKPPTLIERLKMHFDVLFSRMDKSFSTRLLKLIDKKGKTDVEVYKKAHIDRRLFSKIRSDKEYKPSKNTVVALIIALELNDLEATELINSAGYSFSLDIKEDVVVLYFIENGLYDIDLINEVLSYYDLPVLGERKK